MKMSGAPSHEQIILDVKREEFVCRQINKPDKMNNIPNLCEPQLGREGETTNTHHWIQCVNRRLI
jgi:hypothetical protein